MLSKYTGYGHTMTLSENGNGTYTVTIDSGLTVVFTELTHSYPLESAKAFYAGKMKDFRDAFGTKQFAL